MPPTPVQGPPLQQCDTPSYDAPLPTQPNQSQPPAGGGEDCEDIGKRHTFGVAVKIDRPCDDAEAAAIAANIKSELSAVVPYTCPLSASPGCEASLSVLFASCDDVPAPRDAGSGGVGPWGVFTYRVEYYTDNGSAEGALKSAVRDNTRVTCNSAAASPYFDFFCEHELVGAPDASCPTLTKRWAIAVPVTSGVAGGGCPTGERAAVREAEVRGALTAALQLLVGMVELRSVDFLQCNRLARTADVVTGSNDTVTRPVIEYWYNVVETHDYYAATDLEVSPYATLYDASSSNPDNDYVGSMDEALPLLSDSLKGKYVPELSYVGPPVTCLAGGPRVYPIDPASNSTGAATTLAPLYYLANGGAVTAVGEFFDPRALSPWAVVQRAGGAAVRLVDDTEGDQGAVLEAKGKNGDYSQDRLVAVRGRRLLFWGEGGIRIPPALPVLGGSKGALSPFWREAGCEGPLSALGGQRGRGRLKRAFTLWGGG